MNLSDLAWYWQVLIFITVLILCGAVWHGAMIFLGLRKSEDHEAADAWARLTAAEKERLLNGHG